MNLKQLIVVRPPEGLFEIWTRKEYDDYMTHTISAGAVPAYSIVTHFNGDERLLAGEELKEGGGLDEYAAQFAGTREEWVSVEKELPEVDEEVLACSEYDNWMVTAFRKKSRWFNSWDIGNKNAVPIFPTHWRKLPNPPNTNILKPI